MRETIEEFWQQYQWLYTFIQDSKGDGFLHDRTPIEQRENKGDRIARIAEFLDFIDNPQTQYNSVHVAGTSGKGSVTVAIDAILRACGFHCGHHTSPYLQIPNEKLVADGCLISPSEFTATLKAFRQLYEAYTHADGPFNFLKYGEVWVALTYYWFARRQLDWIVMETGAGGRYDPTNVLPSQIAVITSIGYDHVQSLGPTLADIARHKAGIIKPHCPAIAAVTDPMALEVIQQEATLKNAPLYLLDRDITYHIDRSDAKGLVLNVQTPFNHYANLNLALVGQFQAANAALAIATVDLLAQTHHFSLTRNQIHAALSTLTYPGRMEIVQQDPTVVLDGAHNPDKIQALVQALQDIYPDRRVTCILGMLAAKNATSIVQTLTPLVSRFIATQPYVYGKLSLPATELANLIQSRSPQRPVTVLSNVTEALTETLPTLTDRDLLLVTGSIYLIGEARNYWYPISTLLESL